MAAVAEVPARDSEVQPPTTTHPGKQASCSSVAMPDFQVSIVVSVARDYDYYPEKKSPALDFDDIPIGEGDDESFGSAEYGEEATAFNEDGSFIGVYSKDKKSPNAPPAYQPATESNV